MTYDEFLKELIPYSEEPFARFQNRLIQTKAKILGVRTPILRKLAKKYFSLADIFIAFPDEYYEVTFIKLSIVSLMGFDGLKKNVESCVQWIDNWATCDSFKPSCLKQRKDEFLPVLENIFNHGGEFYERFALVLLLGYYVEEKYLTTIKSYIKRANTNFYYVRMAVAWLAAELLIKFPSCGKEILNEGILDKKTHNKAIQKARESYRVDKKEKEFLYSLKLK
ncbi:MAG: DNA alkylation repair protein [Clostridiales bacterium]|nr:DNA alkylation repair protein [Clostridiales bacterium]